MVAVAGWGTEVLAIIDIDPGCKRFGVSGVRYAFKAKLTGRVQILDDLSTHRVETTDLALGR
ncbi:hypothetical protein ACQB60_34270 [Actinomycetota bacterium Odt1-20B]